MNITSCMTAFQRFASHFFVFFFSATLYQQWIDLFGRLNFSCQNSYPANTFTSISRMNKNTNEQDGSQCFPSLLDLWLRNQNRNFGQWSFKSKSKSVQKNNQNRTFRRNLNDTKNSGESTWHGLHRARTSWFKFEKSAIKLRNSFWSAIS